jgi:hypothetical protein
MAEPVPKPSRQQNTTVGLAPGEKTAPDPVRGIVGTLETLLNAQ